MNRLRFAQRLKRPSRGFTLIELAVVIAVLGIVLVLVLPRVSGRGNGAEAARGVASMLRYLQDRAASTRSVYLLRFTLADGQLKVLRRLPTGEEGPPDEQFIARILPGEGTAVEDVNVSPLGKVTEGEVTVPIGPAGLQELLLVHLKEGERRWTVLAFPAGGKVKIADGYVEGAL